MTTPNPDCQHLSTEYDHWKRQYTCRECGATKTNPPQITMSENSYTEPAFPGPAQHEQHADIHEGMSLRDYFAAKAMAAMVAHNPGIGLSQLGMNTIANQAYAQADAMLHARLSPHTVKPINPL